MRLYGLRLLVALLTFGVGVAAASLLTFKRGPCGAKRPAASAPVFAAAPPSEAPPPAPPRSACSANRAAYVVQGGVLNGKAVSKPLPLYPAEARAAGVRGTVVVKIVVDEGGGVESAAAESGPFMLRESAEEAARQARFSPTLLSGQPVRVSGVVTYNFGLR